MTDGSKKSLKEPYQTLHTMNMNIEEENTIPEETIVPENFYKTIKPTD